MRSSIHLRPNLILGHDPSISWNQSSHRDLGFDGSHDIFLQPFRGVHCPFLQLFDLLTCGLVLLASVIHHDAGYLYDADDAEEEVYCCQPKFNLISTDLGCQLEVERKGQGLFWRVLRAYKIFLGLMIKHHLVQIRPVAVRAIFCVRESFSGGL